MGNDSRILTLLEHILDSGATPEEACRDCPELLPIVRERLELLRSVEAEIAAAFPPRDSPSARPPAFLGNPSGTLPDIAGYDVQEVIGSGGMGIVYRARHRELDRIVAVRLLLAGGYAAPFELERFKREAHLLAALRHPNIVEIYDAGEHDGFHYLTMEFIQGGRLADKLGGAQQPAHQAAAIVATLARAMAALHERGIVHRDLKPGNILLAMDGTLKIADFGLCRRLDAMEAALAQGGSPVGTPGYMAPEQVLCKPSAVCPATDVYALGAILYEMLTGRPPFRGDTHLETRHQVLSDDPVPPAEINPDTPEDLQAICLKCLEKVPQRRYQSAAQLADDLDRFLRTESAPTRARV